MTTSMFSKGLNAPPGPLPVSSTLPLVQCLPPEPLLGRYLAVPMEGEEAVGSERTRARSHVGASLLPRPRRRVVVVGRRIRDVRMTASSPQQEAEECRQTSSVSHWISSLSRASPVGRQAPETGGAGNRVAICSPDCRSYRPTGQTTCWDSSGTVIPCAGTGEDGDL